MTSPRKPMALASAPVLFRLPDLHAQEAANQADSAAAASPSVATGGFPTAPPAHTPGTLARGLDAPGGQPSAGPPQAHGVQRANVSAAAFAATTASARSISQHLEICRKHPAILVAMVIVACGSWVAGRYTAGPQAVDTAAPAEVNAQLSARDALRGTAVSADPPLAEPTNPGPVPTGQGSPLDHQASQASQHRAEQDAVASDTSEYYQLEEGADPPESSPELTQSAKDESLSGTTQPEDDSAAIAKQAGTEETAVEETDEAVDPSALFAKLSSDALNPPENQPEPTTPPADAEPSETAPASDQLADKTTAEPTPDATPASEQPPPTEEKSQKLRRVLSRTPNDIPDWSRYLPGANASVRAASAEGPPQPAGASQPTSQQAFYLDNE